MRQYLVVAASAAWLAACGGSPEAPGDASTVAGPAGATASAPGQAAGGPAAAAAPAAAASSAAAGGLPGRTGELVNPDNNTMVFLYYDLTGNPPPIDSWVEEDNRVQFAPAIDKAAMRQTVRAELESGIAAVRGVGMLRLTLGNANVSDYDPTYGEFTIRALAPSSEVNFDALGQKVAIRFTNGRTAQIWKVPAGEAQLIRDKIGHNNTEIDLLLRIKSVQPGPGGGTIMTEVLEYELRESRSGATLARAQLPPS
jgi:hypothetical protein